MTKPIDMKGKTVVITGGSSGVGLALAQNFLDRGASKIALIARSKEGLDRAISSLKKDDSQIVKGFTGDVSNYDNLSETFKSVHEFIDTIDFLFANAGYAKPGLLSEMDGEILSKQINTNFLGAAYTTRLALPYLKKGSHVNYSGSVCSVFSFAGYSAYGPSKYALRGFAETLRNELKSSGIHVHMSIFSTVDTPGLKHENESKPDVCAKIEGTANIFTPKQIADKVLQGIDRGD